MPTYSLEHLNNVDYSKPVLIYPPDYKEERKQSNPFEDTFKSYFKNAFQEFLVQNDNAKIDQRVRELEKTGIITIHWDKVNKKEEKGEPEVLSDETKQKARIFFIGFGLGMLVTILIL
jgi:hypothetical protein